MLLANWTPAKQLFYDKFTDDTRSRGRLYMHFKDMNQAFQILKICPKSWDTIDQTGIEQMRQSGICPLQKKTSKRPNSFYFWYQLWAWIQQYFWKLVIRHLCNVFSQSYSLESNHPMNEVVVDSIDNADVRAKHQHYWLITATSLKLWLHTKNNGSQHNMSKHLLYLNIFAFEGFY